MIETKEFQKTGAEPPCPHQDPLIGMMQVDNVPNHSASTTPYIAEDNGNNATVIADKTGITINLFTDELYAASFEMQLEFEESQKFLDKIQPRMTLEELEKLGFEFIEY